MTPQTSHFDFYGVRVSISSDDPSLLRYFAEDFGYFLSEAPSTAHLQLHLFNRRGERKGFWRLFKTRMCRTYRVRGARLCDYAGGSQTIAYDPVGGNRVFEVYSESPDERYEMAFVALLSGLGEQLDARGFHRIHALGVEPGVLAVLPQGGGKSAMAALFARSGERRIFSDEIPLVNAGLVHPFPLRIALRPQVANGLQLPEGRRFKRKIFDDKILFPLLEKQTASPTPIRAILIGRKSLSGIPKVLPASRWRVFAGLMHSLVVGVGVPQMREFMLRPAPVLLAIFFSRLRQAAGLALHTPGFIFELCTDARLNAAVLSDFCQREISNEDSSHSAQSRSLPHQPHYSS